jgi:hypothetical protein
MRLILKSYQFEGSVSMLIENNYILPCLEHTCFILLNRLFVENLCCKTDNADPPDPQRLLGLLTI